MKLSTALLLFLSKEDVGVHAAELLRGYVASDPESSVSDKHRRWIVQQHHLLPLVVNLIFLLACGVAGTSARSPLR